MTKLSQLRPKDATANGHQHPTTIRDAKDEQCVIQSPRGLFKKRIATSLRPLLYRRYRRTVVWILDGLVFGQMVYAFSGARRHAIRLKCPPQKRQAGLSLISVLETT